RLQDHGGDAPQPAALASPPARRQPRDPSPQRGRDHGDHDQGVAGRHRHGALLPPAEALRSSAPRRGDGMSTELFAGTTVRALMREPVPPVATSTATRRRTSSAASAGSRSKFPSAKRDSDDVLMAIDTILTVAPGAQVVVHGAPFTGPGTSFQTLFNAMIN